MAEQTTFEIQDAKDLLYQLEQMLSTLKSEWAQVSNQWSSLSMTWYDLQREEFEPIYDKLLDVYSSSQLEIENHITFINEQIRIAEERSSKLAGLKGF